MQCYRKGDPLRSLPIRAGFEKAPLALKLFSKFAPLHSL